MVLDCARSAPAWLFRLVYQDVLVINLGRLRRPDAPTACVPAGRTGAESHAKGTGDTRREHGACCPIPLPHGLRPGAIRSSWVPGSVPRNDRLPGNCVTVEPSHLDPLARSFPHFQPGQKAKTPAASHRRGLLGPRSRTGAIRGPLVDFRPCNVPGTKPPPGELPLHVDLAQQVLGSGWVSVGARTGTLPKRRREAFAATGGGVG